MHLRPRTILSLPVILLTLVLTLPAQKHPDFTGTWKLNEAASGSTPTGVHGTVFKIEHRDPAFKYSASGQRGMAPFSEVFEFTTRGKPPADPAKVSVVGYWEGQALALRYMKGGRELARFVMRLSPDARQMTREGDIGKNHVREIYDRQ